MLVADWVISKHMFNIFITLKNVEIIVLPNYRFPPFMYFREYLRGSTVVRGGGGGGGGGVNLRGFCVDLWECHIKNLTCFRTP